MPCFFTQAITSSVFFPSPAAEPTRRKDSPYSPAAATFSLRKRLAFRNIPTCARLR